MDPQIHVLAHLLGLWKPGNEKLSCASAERVEGADVLPLQAHLVAAALQNLGAQSCPWFLWLLGAEASRAPGGRAGGPTLQQDPDQGGLT